MDWKFWKKKKPEPTAVWLKMFEMLEYQARNNYIGIDAEHRYLTMRIEAYNIHICNGAYTMPVALKAHAYLKGVRQYMNTLISTYNGEQGTKMPLLEETDAITIGVIGEDDKLILVGEESKDEFWLVPYSAPSPDLSPNGEE